MFLSQSLIGTVSTLLNLSSGSLFMTKSQSLIGTVSTMKKYIKNKNWKNVSIPYRYGINNCKINISKTDFIRFHQIYNPFHSKSRSISNLKSATKPYFSAFFIFVPTQLEIDRLLAGVFIRFIWFIIFYTAQ